MAKPVKGRRGFAVLSASALLLLAACHASTLPSAVRLAGAPRTAAEQSLPLVYWSEQRSADTLAIHVVRVDLRSSAFELDVIVAEDPDGSGPAEAALADPRILASRANTLVAVNANAFAGVPDSTGKPDSRWRAQLPVNIAGIAVHDGATRSRGADSSAINMIFGIDESRRPYVGPALAGIELQEAVNAWSFRLLDNGRPVPHRPSGGNLRPVPVLLTIRKR